jgi:hypothetical protein
MLWDRCTFAQISNVGPLRSELPPFFIVKNPSRARAALISNRVAFCFVTPETSCSHHRRNCRKDLSPLAVRIARWQECREQCSCRCCVLGQRWGRVLRRRCGFRRRLQRRRPLRKDGVVVDGRRVNASREELRTVMAGAPLRLRGATAAGRLGAGRGKEPRLAPLSIRCFSEEWSRDSGCRRQRRASAKGPPRSVMIPAPAIARRPSAESPPCSGSPTTSTKLRRRPVGRPRGRGAAIAPRERHVAVQLETVRLAPAHGRLSRRSGDVHVSIDYPALCASHFRNCGAELAAAFRARILRATSFCSVSRSTEVSSSGVDQPRGRSISATGNRCSD